MDNLKYILQRVMWLRDDINDYDTYSELVDWLKRMEYECDIDYDDEADFLEWLVDFLRTENTTEE